MSASFINTGFSAAVLKTNNLVVSFEFYSSMLFITEERIFKPLAYIIIGNAKINFLPLEDVIIATR